MRVRIKFCSAKMNDGIVTLAKWWMTDGDNKRMSTQDAKDRQRQRQSGKSMGEFGENYSYRKRYQHDYHDSSGVKWVEPSITPQGKTLPGWPSDDDEGREPIRKEYEPHVIEPFVSEEELTDLYIGSVIEKNEKKDEL